MKRFALFFVTVSLIAGCNNAPEQETTVNEEPVTTEGTDGESENEESALPDEVTLTVKTPGETMNEMRFEPSRIEVAANAKVTLILDNIAESEAMIHNFVVIEFGSQSEVTEAGLEAGPENEYVPDSPKIIAATALAKPGEEQRVEFTAPSEKGTYQFICTYPGHTKMKGVLLVK